MRINRTRQKVYRLLLPIVLGLVLSVTAIPVSVYVKAEDKASFIYHQIQVAKEQEAQGRYSQACKTLLQTLTSKNIDCESLNQDDNFDKVETALNQQFPNSGKSVNDLSLKVTALLGFGDALGVVVSLDKSMEVLQRSLEVAKQVSSQAEAEALLSLGNTAQALGNRKRDTEDSIRKDYDEHGYVNEAQPALLLVSCESDEPQKEQNSSHKQAIAFYQESIAYYQLAACKANSPITRAQAELNRFNILIQIDKWLQSNYPQFADNWWLQVASQIPENWNKNIQ